MSHRSGLGSSLGFKQEAIWGTPETVNRFIPFTSESIALDKQYVESRGLRAGRMYQSGPLHVATTRSASGSVTFEALYKDMGQWLNLLHGNTVTPTQVGTTGAYTQTHNIGTTPPDGAGKSLTVQVGRPDTAGVVQPFTYEGGKCVGVTFACDVGGLLTTTWNLDFQDELTATALAAASYSTNNKPFVFTQGVAEVDDVAVANVNSFSLEIGQAMKVDRFFLGSAGVKAEPIVNDYATATANLNLEFNSMAAYAKFTASTRTKLELNFTGDVISGAEAYKFNITLPQTVYTGQTPTVDGPDVLNQEVPVVALDDGTNAPVQVVYQSTDSAL